MISKEEQYGYRTRIFNYLSDGSTTVVLFEPLVQRRLSTRYHNFVNFFKSPASMSWHGVERNGFRSHVLLNIAVQ